MQDSIDLKRFKINFFIDFWTFEEITGIELEDMYRVVINENVVRELVDCGASSMYIKHYEDSSHHEIKIKDVSIFGIELVEGFDPEKTHKENRKLIRDELAFVSKHGSDNHNVRETARHLLEVFDGLYKKKLRCGEKFLCDVTPIDVEKCAVIHYQPLHCTDWVTTRLLAEGDEVSFTSPVTDRNSHDHRFTGNNNERPSGLQVQGVIMPPGGPLNDPDNLGEHRLLITHTSHKKMFPVGTVTPICAIAPDDNMTDWHVQRKVWADEKLRAKKICRSLDPEVFEQSVTKAKSKTKRKSKTETKNTGETLGR